MDTPKDSKSGSNSISPLKNFSLVGTLKTKAERTIFRLIAGGIGFSYFERIRENLDIIEGRSKVNTMLAEEVGRQAIADPEVMERAKARFLSDVLRKQENVEAIAKAAEKKINDSSDADKVTVTKADISDDWLNAFSREAEMASSEQLRDRLANILAGEIRKPGTFGRSTVRLVAELDEEVLSNFQSALNFRIGDALYRHEICNHGTWYTKAVILEDAGLLSGSPGLTQRTITINSEGVGVLPGEHIGIVLKGKVGVKKNLRIMLLTKAGRDIAGLLPPIDEADAFRKAANDINKSDLESIILGKKVILDDGKNAISQDEIIWQKSDSSHSVPTK